MHHSAASSLPSAVAATASSTPHCTAVYSPCLLQSAMWHIVHHSRVHTLTSFSMAPALLSSCAAQEDIRRDVKHGCQSVCVSEKRPLATSFYVPLTWFYTIIFVGFPHWPTDFLLRWQKRRFRSGGPMEVFRDLHGASRPGYGSGNSGNPNSRRTRFASPRWT